MSEVVTGTTADAATTAEERHASWLELFFDLIVAAGVAEVAHRLRDVPTLADTAACVAVFYAVWSTWTAFSTYANVAGEKTHKRALLAAMLGIGAMVAATPGVLPELLPHGEEFTGDRTTVFIVAFVVCRGLAGNAARGTGKVIGFWPAAQGVVAAPWLVSIFVDPDLRYWLWGAGIVIDVMVAVRGARDPEAMQRMVDRAQQHQERERRGLFSRFVRRYRPSEQRQIEVAEPERAHLEERLSLFVIIVLGEALAELVSAASAVEWHLPALVTLLAGFGLLVGIWQLTAWYGVSPVPGADDSPLPPWAALQLHFVVLAGIAGIAAGLGGIAAHPTAATSAGYRWYLCGGLALYLLAALLSGIGRPVARSWLFGWLVPGLVAAVVLGVLAGPLPGWALTLVVAAVTGWQVTYEPIHALAVRRRATLAR
jgi:low temperature requirement protein LtrA